jgi:integrase
VSAARKPKRNANREGRVWQRSDGRWTARVYGPEKGSKPHYVYGRTREDAKAAKKALEDDLAKGMPAQDQTIAEFFENWLTKTLPAQVAAGHLAASTLDSYSDNARKHILPGLGHVQLRQLRPSRVREWQAELLRKPSGKPRVRLRPGETELPPAPTLSPRTVGYCQAILRRAINDAWADSLVSQNVVAKVPVPKLPEKKERVFSADEMGALLEESSKDRLWCYWLTVLMLGLRRGECLALRWSDIDFDARTIRLGASVQRLRGEPDPQTGRRKGTLVRKGMKTEASADVVGFGDALFDALRTHQREQREARLRSRVWLDKADLVFTTSVGTALEPRGVNRSWAKVCERAGVPGARVHDLRHAFGTTLADAGFHPKVIQKALRHSRMATTEIYVHAAKEVNREVPAAMDRVVTGLRQGSRRASRRSS